MQKNTERKPLLLTILYKPHTVRVPRWAEDDVARLTPLAAAGNKRARAQLSELLNDISEHEGWYPQFQAFTLKGGR